MKMQPLVMSDVLAAARQDDGSPESQAWMVRLLREEGTDLLSADPSSLGRGTPVYVEAAADVLAVQRLMAKNHIRFLPVVKDEELVGIVDLVDLAQRDDLAPDDSVERAATR